MDQIDHCSFDHYFTLLFTPGTQSPVAQNGKSHIRFSIFLVALDSLIGHTSHKALGYKWTFRQKNLEINPGFLFKIQSFTLLGEKSKIPKYFLECQKS